MILFATGSVSDFYQPEKRFQPLCRSVFDNQPGSTEILVFKTLNICTLDQESYWVNVFYLFGLRPYYYPYLSITQQSE